SGVTNDALWYFRLGLNGGSQGGFHTMYVILSDPNTRTNHPEYYALYNGKRDLYSRGGKPCLSSEGFFSNMVEYARAHFDVYPQADEFTVMPGDGYTIMCQCDLCKGKDTPERGWEGTISDYVWGFVNRVAGEIQKSHPGRKIHCAAYGTYLLPPEKIQLHTNITVRIVAPTLGAFSGDPARRPHVIAIRNAWLAKLPPGSMLSAHEQNIQNQPGRKGEGLPIFFMREIAEDLKSWNGKLLGENVEVWQTGGGIGGPGLNHLHYYLTGRLYWDSKQELDRLLGDYYSRFFGSAREEMKSFYERAEKTCMRFEAPDIEYLLATLKAAEDKAGTNTVYGRRVALIRGECEPKLRELLLQRNSKEEYARLEISPQTVENISVDGQLNEAFWSGLSNNPLRDAVSGGAPKFSTSFRIGSDGANLCIGVRCLEPDMQSLIEAGQKRDDMNVWMDDAVEVILKTPRRSFYQFAINPKGALVDLDRSQGMQGIVWDANVAAATARGTNEWTVELTIPFKDILGDKPTAEQPWHINICRNRPRDKNTELSIFVPSGKPTFQNTEKMAVLVVKEPAGEE
ncbi:MAG: DUF4838 domain-containing protein, partial [Kiritimatiellia bacterium]